MNVKDYTTPAEKTSTIEQDEFIAQLKKKRGFKRVDFLKQHLQDSFWVGVTDGVALKIFRLCCAAAGKFACEAVEIFNLLYQVGCFNKVVQQFKTTRIITPYILSLINISVNLLDKWFAGPVKFKSVKIFYRFLHVIGFNKYHNINNIKFIDVEKYLSVKSLKLDDISGIRWALIYGNYYNGVRQSYDYVINIFTQANKDIIDAYNNNHIITKDVISVCAALPRPQEILKPPYIFNNIAMFAHMISNNVGVYYDGTHRNILENTLSYFNNHLDELHFKTNDIHDETITSNSYDEIIILLCECLNNAAIHLYNKLIGIIKQCRDVQHFTELWDKVDDMINFIPGDKNKLYKIQGDLSSTYLQHTATNDTVTADDIKELFDI